MKPPAESVNQRPAVLAAHHNAGISKKTKRSRKSVLSSKARRRHEKGADRAEAIMDRTAQKIAKSKGQARAIKSRRKTWDEINQEIPPQPTATRATKDQEGAEDDESDVADAHISTDDEMAAVDGGDAPPVQGAPDDEDEIL